MANSPNEASHRQMVPEIIKSLNEKRKNAARAQASDFIHHIVLLIPGTPLKLERLSPSKPQ